MSLKSLFSQSTQFTRQRGLTALKPSIAWSSNDRFASKNSASSGATLSTSARCRHPRGTRQEPSASARLQHMASSDMPASAISKTIAGGDNSPPTQLRHAS